LYQKVVLSAWGLAAKVSGAYMCEFRGVDDEDQTLFYAPVAAFVSVNSLTCISPYWGLTYSAATTFLIVTSTEPTLTNGYSIVRAPLLRYFVMTPFFFFNRRDSNIELRVYGVFFFNFFFFFSELSPFHQNFTISVGDSCGRFFVLLLFKSPRAHLFQWLLRTHV
jgi:hypothetical protein